MFNLFNNEENWSEVSNEIPWKDLKEKKDVVRMLSNHVQL
jgi:hypothetical protein